MVSSCINLKHLACSQSESTTKNFLSELTLCHKAVLKLRVVEPNPK